MVVKGPDILPVRELGGEYPVRRGVDDEKNAE